MSASRRWWARELLVVAVMWAAMCVAFAFHYRFFDSQKLNQPLDYWGDALFTAGLIKACEQGSYVPVLSKEVWTHGAPGVAHWDDFPIPEQTPLCAVGWLARVVGLFTAINLAFLGAMLVAALSAYVVARLMRSRWVVAAPLAILYGMSPYIVGRTVHHYNLVFYWFLPFVVLVCMWLASRRGVELRSPKFWLAVLVAFTVGLHNPYYTNFSLQMIVLSGVAGALRRRSRRRGLATMGVFIGVTLGTMLIVTSHTFFYVARNGPNREVAGRSATDLERFALKPLEVFFPHQPHDFPPFQAAAAKYDREQRVLQSERSYLGLVGSISLLAVLGVTVLAVMRRKWSVVADLGALAAWLMFYASPAGLNGVTGLLGITLFRSTNRVSIVLMTLGTLGAARLISRATRKVRAMWLVPLAAMVIVGGISEQLFPRWTVQQHDGIRARAESDRGLVEQLQARIPKGSKVFQLPVVGFPEESYEPFRPFLFSDGLKFSYAAMRGRPEANWQRQTAALAPHEMLAALRQEGFRAIYVLGDGNALFQAIRAEAPQAEFLVSADRSSSVIVIPAN